MMLLPPLSLYVHIPWCVKKCPYCDFNSHVNLTKLPENEYVDALLDDLNSEKEKLEQRQFQTIFFGGGTPSLFSADAIKRILAGVQDLVGIASTAEITLEANPGTAEQSRFRGYYAAGVNRLSIGVQSFDADKLALLGRIHSGDNAQSAIMMAHEAGFTRINCDLMYGLPQQTVDEAVADLEIALSLKPDHLSWYNLTIEPNTLFYTRPPELPDEETIEAIEQAGYKTLRNHDFSRYEISAYARTPTAQSRHNLNYWCFGDYLGIGAGAHSKITFADGQKIRWWKQKVPSNYLDSGKPYTTNQQILSENDCRFEFMLNAARLIDGVETRTFTAHTGLPLATLNTRLEKAEQKQLLSLTREQNLITHFKPTSIGLRYLNDLILIFQ